MFRLPKKRRRPQLIRTCPHCGTAVPGHKLACPECGSDENTGWKSEDEILESSLDLNEEFEESSGSWLRWVALIVALVFVVGYVLPPLLG